MVQQREFLPGSMQSRAAELMKRENISQAALAEKIGISASAMSRFMTEDNDKMSVEAIGKMAQTLHVSADFLLGLTNVPDTMGYYLEELGLTAKAAESLYTGKADPQVVSSLLENERFQHLTYLLLGYFNDNIAKGFAAQNQMYQMISGAVSSYPDAQKDIEQLQIDPRMAEKANLQAEFMAAVQEMKLDGSTEIAGATRCMSRIMDTILACVTKRTGILRPTVVMEQIADGVIKAVELQSGPLDQTQRKSLKKSWRETVQLLIRKPHGTKP